MKTRIQPVQNNKQKGKTYAMLMAKYKDAMDNGYYGEAELIVYAFLEDRLKSFIYYSNLIDTWNTNSTNENALHICCGIDKIDKISSKTKLIEKAISLCTVNNKELSVFEQDLKKAYKTGLDVSALKKDLKAIRRWCDYRNEIIHALFNKDLEDLRKGYENHIREGYELGRRIDKYVTALKNA